MSSSYPYRYHQDPCPVHMQACIHPQANTPVPPSLRSTRPKSSSDTSSRHAHYASGRHPHSHITRPRCLTAIVTLVITHIADVVPHVVAVPRITASTATISAVVTVTATPPEVRYLRTRRATPVAAHRLSIATAHRSADGHPN